MRKKLENFDVIVGDIALAKVTRNKTNYIEVVCTYDENIRGLLDFTSLKYISGNIPVESLSYILAKAKRNKKYLED